MWEDEAGGGSKAHGTQENRKMMFITLFVPGTGASLCHILYALNSPLGGTLVVPMLQMRKLRHKESK